MIIYQHRSLHFKENSYFSINRYNRKTGMHWHEAIEFMFFVNGRLEVSLNGKTVEAGAGDLVVVNSSVLHASRITEEPLDYYVVLANEEFFREKGLFADSVTFEPLIRSDTAKSIFSRIIEEFEKNDGFSTPAILAELMSLFVYLNRKHKLASESCPKIENKKLLMVRGALDYIQKNYKNRITVEEIAAALHFSKSYLGHTFKEMTKHSIIDFINLLRCNNAKALILGGASVSEAAEECGFCDLSYFTRVFKKTIGTLPSAVNKD